LLTKNRNDKSLRKNSDSNSAKNVNANKIGIRLNRCYVRIRFQKLVHKTRLNVDEDIYLRLLRFVHESGQKELLLIPFRIIKNLIIVKT